MVIKKQPIITWLLENRDSIDTVRNIGTPFIHNPSHFQYLQYGLLVLNQFHHDGVNWGLPEFITNSFKDVMIKNAKSFEKFRDRIYKDFSNEKLCGILLVFNRTFIYKFIDNKLIIWVFKNEKDGSHLKLWYNATHADKDWLRIESCPGIEENIELLGEISKDPKEIYEFFASFITTYLIVKGHLKVETVVIQPNTTEKLNNLIEDYYGKDKIKNDSGQKVIVMDSRLLRKIVNNKDIYVRGFFRMQNKKNADGEWYKEIIFVDQHVRHGYHRNAVIENINSDK